ncbi:MAG: hypothetical protein QOE28_2296, partial [Solirubrobacteraceae bacterium]|nr:hypothetical protein [Solirubrobacteraceae bacterium]
MIRRPLLIALVATAIYSAVLTATAPAQLPAVPTAVPTVTLPVDTPTVVPTPGLPLPTPTVPGVPVASPTATPTPTVPPNPATGGGDQGSQPSQAQQQAAQQEQSSRKKRRGGANTQSLKGKLRKEAKRAQQQAQIISGRNLDGSPSLSNPTISLATPGAAPIGVPNFFIDKFRIPPFLLPIYQAAGIQYGIRWEVLAAINEIETDYGRNLNVSSAGAVGWMQFMPSTWKLYGVDANRDGEKDPFNPVDAIFAAARYLRAAGGDKDITKAIFSYNHADWYVQSVLLRARVIGGLPSNLVGSLTGLTQGRFPVHAKASYADDISERDLKAMKGKGNKAVVVDSGATQRGIKIFSRNGAPVVAVNDGKITDIGTSKRLGNFIKLQDVYGNTYTYGHLGSVAKRYPAPKPSTKKVTSDQIRRELKLPAKDAAPTAAASDTSAPATRAPKRSTAAKAQPKLAKKIPARKAAAASPRTAVKQRLFAHPRRPNAAKSGGAQQEFQRTGNIDGVATFKGYFSRVFGLDRKDVQLKPLKKGSSIIAGTILGRIGKTSKVEAPHVLFEIRPAGRGAPRIDPKPILDGWKLLESTAIYRAAGKNPFFGSDADAPSIGQILLMSKESLVQRVLNDPNIQIYECGRRDIQTGQIDRRVLATLEFLVASGFKPTVSALKCGHSLMTVSGNISEHSTGTAVDIAAVNGIPIVGHQGPGSITELTIQRLLTLQGTMKPHQIISLMTFQGADNTLAMADHYDHIHVGFRPMYGANAKASKQINAILKPNQWIKLIDRIGQIDNPTVSR